MSGSADISVQRASLGVGAFGLYSVLLHQRMFYLFVSCVPLCFCACLFQLNYIASFIFTYSFEIPLS